jgi:hypothetical protein
VIKIYIINVWVMTLRNLKSRDDRFGGIFCLHLQGMKININLNILSSTIPCRQLHFANNQSPTVLLFRDISTS